MLDVETNGEFHEQMRCLAIYAYAKLCNIGGFRNLVNTRNNLRSSSNYGAMPIQGVRFKVRYLFFDKYTLISFPTENRYFTGKIRFFQKYIDFILKITVISL